MCPQIQVMLHVSTCDLVQKYFRLLTLLLELGYLRREMYSHLKTLLLCHYYFEGDNVTLMSALRGKQSRHER